MSDGPSEKEWVVYDHRKAAWILIALIVVVLALAFAGEPSRETWQELGSELGGTVLEESASSTLAPSP